MNIHTSKYREETNIALCSSRGVEVCILGSETLSLPGKTITMKSFFLHVTRFPGVSRTLMSSNIRSSKADKARM